MKNFAKPVPQHLLNIEDKSRSNLFAWRGQFSPQLIECLLKAYCPENSVVLDPFAGSGTVLLEAASLGFSGYGFELNPSAWSFCKLYEFANISCDDRETIISELRKKIEEVFPIIFFVEEELPPEEIESRIRHIGASVSDEAKILCNALVVLLDIFRNPVSNDLVQLKFQSLVDLVRRLPYSPAMIRADLQDARCLPLQSHSVDFVITSPPYINVFNYHQNYRRSVELMGWDVLRVARSEIGSNRANRGNRFYTVVQYCIDMANTLTELGRVLKPDGRMIFIVGYESKVLGAPFHNADIIEQIADALGIFDLVLRQKRVFKNRFGQSIREDILNLTRRKQRNGYDSVSIVGHNVGCKALKSADEMVPVKNRPLLEKALSRVQEIEGTPIFNSNSCSEYQTREPVMMIREK